jgi:hypothetical protein
MDEWQALQFKGIVRTLRPFEWSGRMRNSENEGLLLKDANITGQLGRYPKGMKSGRFWPFSNFHKPSYRIQV